MHKDRYAANCETFIDVVSNQYYKTTHSTALLYEE